MSVVVAMGVCGNVCCVAAVVKDSVFFSLGVLKYIVLCTSNCGSSLFIDYKNTQIQYISMKRLQNYLSKKYILVIYIYINLIV